MREGEKSFVWNQLPAIGWALLIFAGSSVPASSLPDSAIWRWDKLIHFTIYAVFTFLVHRAFAHQTRVMLLARRAALTTLFAVVAFGFSDEFHQYFVPGRTASIFDVAADAAGAIAVILVILWLGRAQRSAD